MSARSLGSWIGEIGGVDGEVSSAAGSFKVSSMPGDRLSSVSSLAGALGKRSSMLRSLLMVIVGGVLVKMTLHISVTLHVMIIQTQWTVE